MRHAARSRTSSRPRGRVYRGCRDLTSHDHLDANGAVLGIIAARQCQRERATAIADSIGALNRKWSFGAEAWWRAAILVTLGRKDEAVTLLKQATTKGSGMDGWHSNAAGVAP